MVARVGKGNLPCGNERGGVDGEFRLSESRQCLFVDGLAPFAGQNGQCPEKGAMHYVISWLKMGGGF